jgi:hypothetical protein
MYVQEKKHVWIEFFPHLRFLRADQGEAFEVFKPVVWGRSI